ncbi:hypothetical protein [Sphingobacterium bambusae]|uniref:Uncharacterized protein n=1 Tax=Sphingobacterium bambusae TaxID=662858 RepID=A0ABW6BNG9_9SPHI|nr:hypothetical protein [Sphingobacterium bambusae]WPL48143.1 hypothetical protein SCB77_19505 [Sphingobacterium bambusae]
MKGINVSKHRQLKQVLQEVEHTLSVQKQALSVDDIQDCAQRLDMLFSAYQRQLYELEETIELYEQAAHQARMRFFAKPFRLLLKNEPIAEIDVHRLVQAINALAK